MRHRLTLVACAWLMVASGAAAAESDSPLGAIVPQVHGFASQGFILSSGNNYLARSKSGSFEFSEIGVNFTSQLTDRLRLGVQLFAQKLGPLGDYNAKMDWFYLDYRFADWLGFRAGRTKLPFGLYNEVNDIDQARVPILLPQSVYPVNNRNNLLAQTGVEIYGRFDLEAAGALDYRLYGGTIIFPVTSQPGSRFEVQEFRTPYIVGGRLMWETPLEGLRVGGSLQALRIETRLLGTTPATMTMPATPTVFGADIPAVLSIGSAEYAFHDLLLAAEYSRWFVSIESTNQQLLPSGPQVVSERGYAMASYRLATWFQPGAYYSLFFPNVDQREGRAMRQHDVAATLRFDINDHWLLKLEGHYMAGTAGLNSALNDGQLLSALERNWVVFLAKTTAYF
jgi:hypothetical protein